MSEKLLILSLVVLGAFVLLIFIQVGRAVFGSVREEAERRKSEKSFTTAKFGILQGELGTWSGEVVIQGKTIPFAVGGTDDEPDETLLERLESILSRFEHFQKIAHDYLLKENPSSVPLKFTFHDIDVLYPEDPDQFTFSYLLEGDEDGIWRVEFEKETPVFTGRDD